MSAVTYPDLVQTYPPATRLRSSRSGSQLRSSQVAAKAIVYHPSAAKPPNAPVDQAMGRCDWMTWAAPWASLHKTVVHREPLGQRHGPPHVNIWLARSGSAPTLIHRQR
mmetsp:Transcript_29926/g.85776  ORF Transcript_29926/g.85776 Transcript_29926/m.85776 type:complete len:109 (+) Transcript_29926:139-465(+)